MDWNDGIGECIRHYVKGWSFWAMSAETPETSTEQLNSQHGGRLLNIDDRLLRDHFKRGYLGEVLVCTDPAKEVRPERAE